MSKTCVVAADLGSSACKTMVVQVDGRVLGAARQEIDTQFPQLGWAEQNPEDWYEAFCTTVRKAVHAAGVSPNEVAGLGIVGVTHNAVLLDERGRALRNSIVLFDTRSTAQVDAIRNRWGKEIRERSLNDVGTLWTWPQLLWVRQHEPDTWRATRRILFEKDYVRNRLAVSPVTDVIDASGSLLFDPVRSEWIEPFCDDLGIPSDWLPLAVQPTDIVARISAQGAADTGLAVGTPVVAGTSDTAAEVLGAGAVRPGSGVIKLASVGRIAIVALEPASAQRIINYRHVLNGLWYPGTASKYAASAYRWLSEILNADVAHSTTFAEMDAAAASIPVGSDGLIFHPHLNGEWAPHWDDAMRGDFIGLTTHHTRAHIIRSVLEGVAFSLRDAFNAMQLSGSKLHDLRLIGKGACSTLWSTIVADVMNLPLSRPKECDAAYGAALIVAIGIGAIAPTADALESIIRVQQPIHPHPETATRYESLFQIYQDSDQALRSISHRLHKFERN